MIEFGASSFNLIESHSNQAGADGTLTIGPGITVRGTSGSIASYYSNGSLVNEGTIIVSSRSDLSVGGGANSSFTNAGTIDVAVGGTISIPGSVLNGTTGRLLRESPNLLNMSGNLLSSSNDSSFFSGQGTTTFSGGTVGSPRLLEVMGRDIGRALPGFSESNFSFGTLRLANNTHVRLVDLYDNAPDAVPEALYVNTLIIPSSSTLDVAGLPVFVRSLVQSGTLLNGTVTEILDPAISFANADSISIGGEGVGIFAANLNRGGQLDIVASRGNQSGISTLFGDGSGGFSQPLPYAVGFQPWSVTGADFDDDGDVDIATASFGADCVTTLLNDGDGVLASAQCHAAGDGPHAVDKGDFNLDDNVDLVTANWNANTVSVLLGDGQGGFAAPLTFPVGRNPRGLVVADFNSDGRLDVATANASSGTVSVLFGSTSGVFDSAKEFSVGANGPYAITAADFNEDGLPDLAVANYHSTNVSILIAGDDKTFSPPSMVQTGGNLAGIATGDFNNDGKADLAFSDFQGARVGIVAGFGDGSFSQVTFKNVSGQPQSLSTGDFNGDGLLDIVNASEAGTVSLLLNTFDQPTAVIEIAESSDSGSSQSDGITNDTTPTFSIAVNYAGLIEVDYFGDGSIDDTLSAPVAGVYEFTPSVAFSDGVWDIVASLTPTNGLKISSDPFSFTVDTRGPRVTEASLTPTSRIDLTFDSLIDATSVSAGDLKIMGPAGEVVLYSATVQDDKATFWFPQQLAQDPTLYVFGPDIRDIAGNAMNQDGDATNGELVR
ncbi:MAG: FG-GAP-like repeat-containing protein [Pirellulaceae bacterium]